MNITRFDKYYRYFIFVPLLIALLTYWRFRGLEIAGAYSYVAQENVLHPLLQRANQAPASIVWNFFGVVDRMIFPRSIDLLRILGLILVVVNYFLLAKLMNDVLGRRVWGFLCVFVVSLSPFLIISAVAGLPAAAAETVVLLFLIALYNNRYVLAGLLSAVALTANLAGFILFLIAILDLIQNATQKRRMLSSVLYSSTAFFGVAALIFAYSVYTGTMFPAIPVTHPEFPWPPVAFAGFGIADTLVVGGIIYILSLRRFNIYKSHFHLFMVWLALSASCLVQPSTTNLIVTFVVSSILGTFFLQGFAALWSGRVFPVETTAFLFVLTFLFTDVFANNEFLQNRLLVNCKAEADAVTDVVDALSNLPSNIGIVSNFVPAEISVKLSRQVLGIEGEPIAGEGSVLRQSGTVFIVDSDSKSYIALPGSRLLNQDSYMIDGKVHYVKVIKYDGDAK